MSSFELSKLQGATAARALVTSERTELEQRGGERSGKAGESVARSGIALEVATGLNASEPPVDADRVSQIREALRDGTYPLVPTQIADAMFRW